MADALEAVIVYACIIVICITLATCAVNSDSSRRVNEWYKSHNYIKVEVGGIGLIWCKPEDVIKLTEQPKVEK